MVCRPLKKDGGTDAANPGVSSAVRHRRFTANAARSGATVAKGTPCREGGTSCGWIGRTTTPAASSPATTARAAWPTPDSERR